MAEREIRDLIYFDEPKAFSLHSQLVGGLTKEIVSTDQSSSELGSSASLDAKILNLQLGRNKSSGSSYSETKTFHHDVLGRLENLLFSRGFALDLNEALSDGYTNGAVLRDLISGVSYIRLESVAKFHDHSRLIEIIERFPLLAEFISRCASDSIQKSDEYSLISEQINQKRIEIKQISNRNRSATEKAKLDSLQQKLDAIAEENIGESIPQSWFVNGLSNWVNMFNPDHLHVRFDVPNSSDGTQVVANLQRHLFSDSSFEQIAFSYGRKTNISLTLLGLISSVPSAESRSAQNDSLSSLSSTSSALRIFEDAFSKVFDSFDDIEKFALVDNYPNIKVHPIAVYRSIRSYFAEV